MNKLLRSSVNPDKVSSTLKSLVPLIVLIFMALKVDISNTEIETILLTVASVINGCFTLYYFVRKFIS